MRPLRVVRPKHEEYPPAAIDVPLRPVFNPTPTEPVLVALVRVNSNRCQFSVTVNVAETPVEVVTSDTVNRTVRFPEPDGRFNHTENVFAIFEVAVAVWLRKAKSVVDVAQV
jgi:hypothetical protein